jgi:hypothetical protein
MFFIVDFVLIQLVNNRAEPINAKYFILDCF